MCFFFQRQLDLEIKNANITRCWAQVKCYTVKCNRLLLLVLLGISKKTKSKVRKIPSAKQLTKISVIFWKLQSHKINVQFTGDDFTIVADGLQVKNVTEDKLGNYTCTASYTTDRNGFTKSIDIALKQGSKISQCCLMFT